ncbi:hypothetical protein YB2330_006665 [Saitoella coloradoensis]
MPKAKFWAVIVGFTPGVYSNREEMDAATNNCSGYLLRGFQTLADAEAHFAAQTDNVRTVERPAQVANRPTRRHLERLQTRAAAAAQGHPLEPDFALRLSPVSPPNKEQFAAPRTPPTQQPLFLLPPTSYTSTPISPPPNAHHFGVPAMGYRRWLWLQTNGSSFTEGQHRHISMRRARRPPTPPRSPPCHEWYHDVDDNSSDEDSEQDMDENMYACRRVSPPAVEDIDDSMASYLEMTEPLAEGGVKEEVVVGERTGGVEEDDDVFVVPAPQVQTPEPADEAYTLSSPPSQGTPIFIPATEEAWLAVDTTSKKRKKRKSPKKSSDAPPAADQRLITDYPKAKADTNKLSRTKEKKKRKKQNTRNEDDTIHKENQLKTSSSAASTSVSGAAPVAPSTPSASRSSTSTNVVTVFAILTPPPSSPLRDDSSPLPQSHVKSPPSSPLNAPTEQPSTPLTSQELRASIPEPSLHRMDTGCGRPAVLSSSIRESVAESRVGDQLTRGEKRKGLLAQVSTPVIDRSYQPRNGDREKRRKAKEKQQGGKEVQADEVVKPVPWQSGTKPDSYVEGYVAGLPEVLAFLQSADADKEYGHRVVHYREGVPIIADSVREVTDDEIIDDGADLQDGFTTEEIRAAKVSSASKATTEGKGKATPSRARSSSVPEQYTRVNIDYATADGVKRTACLRLHKSVSINNLTITVESSK